jgi:hypothetical protein
MEFPENIKYVIKDRRLSQADELRVRLNELFSIEWQIDAFDSNPAVASLEVPRQAKKLIRTISDLLNQAPKNELTPFENLVYRDLKRNVEIATAYFDYSYNLKTSLRIGSLLAAVFGKGTYTQILDMVRPENWPHKKVFEQARALLPFCSNSFDVEDLIENIHNPLFKKVGEEFKKRLERTKTDTASFYDALGIVPNLRGIHVEFTPPSYGFSFWNGRRMNCAHLDPKRIIGFISPRSTEPEIVDGMLAPLAVHEIGHGLHEHLSAQTMPRGLCPDMADYSPIIHGPVSEGLALKMEDFWLARESKGLSPENRQLARTLIEAYLARKLPQIAYDLLRKSEDEGDSNSRTPAHFNRRAQCKIAELTGIRAYGFIDCFADRKIGETISALSYVIGAERTTKIELEARKRGYNDRQIALGLMKGFWTDEWARREFLFNLYLPELRKKSIK